MAAHSPGTKARIRKACGAWWSTAPLQARAEHINNLHRARGETMELIVRGVMMAAICDVSLRAHGASAWLRMPAYPTPACLPACSHDLLLT
jgi:hypothetical protein